VDTIKSLDKFRVPIGNQAIELQEFVFEAGGMPLLRTRIREGSRFTIFDVDPVTAARWGRVIATGQRRSRAGSEIMEGEN
jgi:hypothetical protein